MSNKRVAVAMSGGVDSSVAAALLQKAGYNIIGITHQTWPGEKQAFGGCCGLESIESARAVAGKLGIPYYVLDLREDFSEKVIAQFCSEYSKGRTPNPCVLCNQYIRFSIMLDKVLKMGIDYLATGHYVRIDKSADGYHLLKAVDSTKDQSYFLYTLRQNELRYLLFPVGDYLKTEVRQIAADIGLPSASRKDSQDICFIQGDYRDFIKSHTTYQPGEFIDSGGKIVGKHHGLAFYTIGQRHGLGIESNEPLYVLKIDATYNRILVGHYGELFSNRLRAGNLNWISGNAPATSTEVTAKIRYKATETKAIIKPDADAIEVEFEKPQMAITPGQSIVFYRGEEMLGGGIIEEPAVVNAVFD